VNDAPETLRERAAAYSPTQLRTIDAALGLFAEHGVGGTSLQMIADALGVTKAAVYHQFHTKDLIVVGVIDVNLEPLEAAVEEAEAAGPSPLAREALLRRVIGNAVVQRRWARTLQHDPVFVRFLGDHEPSRSLWARLFSLLLGDGLDDTGRVRAAVLSVAIGAVTHPYVLGLDDEELVDELLQVVRPLILDVG
jgi:AcrR family transcriptional regulator